MNNQSTSTLEQDWNRTGTGVEHVPHRQGPSDDHDLAVESAESYDDEDVEQVEIGVLFCCGRRLVWRSGCDSDVRETSCRECGSRYAMDLGDHDESEDAWEDRTAWRDAV